MEHHVVNPNPWAIIPFGVLLGAIALAPLLAPVWWHRHYPKVAYVLGTITLLYYLADLHAYTRVWHTAVEYCSFIALIGSLFVVSGGIHISVKGEATPLANTLFLAIGAVVANVLGTTGASMILIRPWLRMNKYRITAHHVVFFIFVVSNMGGCLTPIGDPPLFLGYLRGIPFLWVAERCWPIWLTGIAMVLALFYAVDRRNYLRAPAEVRRRLAEPTDVWRFEGLTNLFFLAVILAAVFINDPPFLREAIMAAAAAGSYFTTRQSVHEANSFNFHPIQEVAILFVGIFATMMPALDWLQEHAAKFGAPTPTTFYWGTGSLSSVLDNAPTYLSFLSTAVGAFARPDLVAAAAEQIQNHGLDLAAVSGSQAETVRQAMGALLKYPSLAQQVEGGATPEGVLQVALLLGNPAWSRCVLAISVGAVFFGASTYIGNGPNFMVKAIAEQKRVHSPTFLGYVFKFTLPYLLPVFLIIWLLFFW